VPGACSLPDLHQEGVATRTQLLEAGFSVAQIRARVSSGRWQLVHRGVYALFNGPVPPLAAVWAALLRSGDGACAGPWTSLWLAGALDAPPRRTDVVVPLERRVSCPGVRVVRRTDLVEVTHPVARPRRLRLEVAVLDACDAMDRPEAVVDLVVRVVQGRFTTVARLRDVLQDRPRHRWRRLVVELLADVGTGVQSALELRWVRTVIRPHGLPMGSLNSPDRDGDGRVYRDVELEEWGLVVELDGRVAHPTEEAFRDRRRDNGVTVSGRATLRYGWREIVEAPCEIGAELEAVLKSRGWKGGRPCTPGCPVGS
jgi:hypothetical protein